MESSESMYLLLSVGVAVKSGIEAEISHEYISSLISILFSSIRNVVKCG